MESTIPYRVNECLVAKNLTNHAMNSILSYQSVIDLIIEKLGKEDFEYEDVPMIRHSLQLVSRSLSDSFETLDRHVLTYLNKTETTNKPEIKPDDGDRI